MRPQPDTRASTVTASASALHFDQINRLLQRHGALQGAAELHGFLCGQLAAGRRLSRGEWLRAASEQADLGQHPDEVSGDLLQLVYSQTLTSLGSGELDFQPLLPDDDAALDQRVAALGQWCQGFLAGFGLAGGADAELAETLQDFGAIAQIGLDDDEASDAEGSEENFVAIYEYVRLAAVDMFWQSQPRNDATATPATEEPERQPASPASLFQRKTLH
jgi:yecA family protein